MVLMYSMLVVNDLWRGRIIQKHNDDHDVQCKCRAIGFSYSSVL